MSARAVLSVLGLALWAGCASSPAYVRRDVGREPRPAVDPSRIHAVLVNGGGSKSINYRSHLVHLRRAVSLLESAGVPAEQVTVFASDGDDPGLDLATQELRVEGDDGWLLDGTELDRTLGRPMEYVSTTIAGVSLRPATKAALAEWFAREGEALRSGDVVLLYVTDHGTPAADGRGPRGNAISLWGKKESLEVDELANLLEGLPTGVQVVTLMSQCYSGGFAQLARGPDDSLPTGSVCGYFSTTEDRQAYGCYAESRGDDEIGHSIDFLQGWHASGRMADAHRFTVVNDQTPDVPLRTSDEYARELLEHAAFAEGRDPVEFADELLAQAWREPERHESQIRFLDRIGQSFGFASPRSLAEIDERLEQLPKVSDPLAEHADAWHAALRDLSRANLKRFLDGHPSWAGRVQRAKVAGLQPEAARGLGTELVSELGPATRRDPSTYARLRELREREETASGASYRMDVRESALLRMQTVLIDVAADVYLQTRATAAERQAYAALVRCEDLALALPASDPPEDREPFPPYADDLEVARAVLPAWMGIQFRQAAADVRERYGLREGAALVQQVFPGSPAEAAGFQPGDVILGPPGGHFVEPRQIREWTMLSRVDRPRRLEILRGGERFERTLVPGPHPGQFPELPAPPGAGDEAPPLRLSAYRADVPASLAAGVPHLLFFWATWCVPCKEALPEILAYSEATGVPIVAITDEPPEQLDRFFSRFPQRFPETVAVDRDRLTFLAYGVSGTPTFVLVGGDGRVASTSTGYSPEKGLGIAGWTWGG